MSNSFAMSIPYCITWYHFGDQIMLINDCTIFFFNSLKCCEDQYKDIKAKYDYDSNEFTRNMKSSLECSKQI